MVIFSHFYRKDNSSDILFPSFYTEAFLNKVSSLREQNLSPSEKILIFKNRSWGANVFLLV